MTAGLKAAQSWTTREPEPSPTSPACSLRKPPVRGRLRRRARRRGPCAFGPRSGDAKGPGRLRIGRRGRAQGRTRRRGRRHQAGPAAAARGRAVLWRLDHHRAAGGTRPGDRLQLGPRRRGPGDPGERQADQRDQRDPQPAHRGDPARRHPAGGSGSEVRLLRQPARGQHRAEGPRRRGAGRPARRRGDRRRGRQRPGGGGRHPHQWRAPAQHRPEVRPAGRPHRGAAGPDLPRHRPHRRPGRKSRRPAALPDPPGAEPDGLVERGLHAAGVRRDQRHGERHLSGHHHHRPARPAGRRLLHPRRPRRRPAGHRPGPATWA